MMCMLASHSARGCVLLGAVRRVGIPVRDGKEMEEKQEGILFSNEKTENILRLAVGNCRGCHAVAER